MSARVAERLFGVPPVASSKAAVRTFAQAVAASTGTTGARCNAVMPSVIELPETAGEARRRPFRWSSRPRSRA